MVISYTATLCYTLHIKFMKVDVNKCSDTHIFLNVYTNKYKLLKPMHIKEMENLLSKALDSLLSKKDSHNRFTI